MGEGAVKNFEEVVLQHPARPTPGVDFSKAPVQVKLPRTVEELLALPGIGLLMLVIVMLLPPLATWLPIALLGR
jgi:endonuclease III